MSDKKIPVELKRHGILPTGRAIVDPWTLRAMWLTESEHKDYLNQLYLDYYNKLREAAKKQQDIMKLAFERLGEQRNQREESNMLGSKFKKNVMKEIKGLERRHSELSDRYENHKKRGTAECHIDIEGHFIDKVFRERLERLVKNMFSKLAPKLLYSAITGKTTDIEGFIDYDMAAIRGCYDELISDIKKDILDHVEAVHIRKTDELINSQAFINRFVEAINKKQLKKG